MSRRKTIAALVSLGGTITMLVLAGNAMALLGFAPLSTFGTEGTGSGQFKTPSGIAVNEASGDLYVADQKNNRIQEFTEAGNYEKTIGAAGVAAGQIKEPTGIALDQSTGNVYVVDLKNNRVEEFDAAGKFVLVFGGTVNKKGGNLCTQGEESECQIGTAGTGTGEFAWTKASRSIIAIHGGTVYVGDQERIQEFTAGGVYQSQIVLAGLGGAIKALAVDEVGNLYASSGSAVHEFSPNGTGVERFDTTSNAVEAIAITPTPEIVVMDAQGSEHGVVFAASGHESVEFTNANPSSGLAFDAVTKRLFVTEVTSGAILSRVSIFQGGPLTKNITKTSKQVGSPASPGMILSGEVNPEGSDASGFFEYGVCTTPSSCATNTYTGSVTAILEGSGSPGTTDFGSGFVPEGVEAKLENLQPLTKYHYRLIGHNVYGNAAGGEGVFATATEPSIDGAPQALFLSPHSAELTGVVDPKYGLTSYTLEYGPCASLGECPTSPYTNSTAPASAGEGLGGVAVYKNVEGLDPATPYHYRLIATNGQGTAQSTEGTFTTPEEPPVAAAPEGVAPAAETGVTSGVGTEAAIVSGAVNPNASPTGYVFEVGVFQGAQTQFGIVTSGEVGAGVEALGESYALSNLQPGVTYAYRIRASNPYGTVYGGVATFTTLAAPVIFTAPIAPPLLAMPPFAFPKVKEPTRAQLLARALKACARKQRSKRAACRRAARKRYGATKASRAKKG